MQEFEERRWEGKREEVARSLPFVLARAPSNQRTFSPFQFRFCSIGRVPNFVQRLLHTCAAVRPSIRPFPLLPLASLLRSLESRGGPGGGGGGGQEERRGQDEVVGL